MSTGYPSIESSLAGLLGLSGPIAAESSAAQLLALVNAYAATSGLVPTILVAASDASPNSRLLAAPEYRCDGTADDVEILAAIGDGNREVALSEGTFTFSVQVVPAVDNVTVKGCGRGTRLNLNGSTPVISAGTQSGWAILNLATDAGGVSLGTGSNNVAHIWKNGVYTERIQYGATAPGGFSVAGYGAGAGKDLVRVGRVTSAYPGLGLSNSAHFFGQGGDWDGRGTFHIDSGYGHGFILGLGLDFLFAKSTYRLALSNPPAYPVVGVRGVTLLGMPQRASDPSTDKDSGTATGGSTLTLIDTSKSWAEARWLDPEAAMVRVGNEVALVDDHTGTTITFAAKMANAVGAGSTYEVAFMFEGDMWYDSAAHVMKFFNGTAIRTVTST